MKKQFIASLLMFTTTLAFVGCKSNDIKNSENWTATKLITENNGSGEKDTIDAKSSSFSAMVTTYYDEHYKKSILCFTKIAAGGYYGTDFKKIEYWYVNENGVLYESTSSPRRYIIKEDGTKVDNPIWKEGKLPTSNESDCEWRKENEETSCFIQKSSDTKQTWIFVRDRSIE